MCFYRCIKEVLDKFLTKQKIANILSNNYLAKINEFTKKKKHTQKKTHLK